MNAIFYHEQNCFIDYDISYILKKNNFYIETVNNIGTLISTIILKKAKIVILKTRNKSIDEIIADEFLLKTLFNGVFFLKLDEEKEKDITYKRDFLARLKMSIEGVIEKTKEPFNIFNIDNKLISLGFLPKYRGYTFLKDCLKFCCYLGDCKKMPMGKIYEKVAQKHNTSAKNVERLIRLTILQSINRVGAKGMSEKTGICEEFFKSMPTTNTVLELLCGYFDFCT